MTAPVCRGWHAVAAIAFGLGAAAQAAAMGGSGVENYHLARQRLLACEQAAGTAPLDHCAELRLIEESLAMEEGALAADASRLDTEIAALGPGAPRAWLELARLRNLVRQERNLDVGRLHQALDRNPERVAALPPAAIFEIQLLVAMAALDSGRTLAARDLLDGVAFEDVPGNILLGLAHRTAGDTHYRMGNFEDADAQYALASAAFAASGAGETLLWTVWSRQAVANVGINDGNAMILLTRLANARNAQMESRSPEAPDKLRLLTRDMFDAAAAFGYSVAAIRRDYYAMGWRCGPRIMQKPGFTVTPPPRQVARYNGFVGLSAYYARRYDVAENCFRWAYGVVYPRDDIDRVNLVQPLVGLAMLTPRVESIDPPQALEYVRAAHLFGDGAIPNWSPELTQLRFVDFTLVFALGFNAQAYPRALLWLGSHQRAEQRRWAIATDQTSPSMLLSAEYTVSVAWAAAHKGDAYPP